MVTGPDGGEAAVCPFCGLGCDDLAVEPAAGGGFAVRSTDCPIARTLYGRAPGAAAPRADGAEVALEAAVARAAELLAASRAPLIAGLGTDVEGVRAALALAEATGAFVDHAASDTLYRNLAVMQRSGWVATTLAELRNRCDLLLVAGPDPARFHPRFYERWVAPAPAFQPDGTGRAVVFLGDEPLPETRAQLAHLPLTVVPAPAERLGGAAAELAAALGDPPGGADALGRLADQLRAARYVVVAWAAAGFAGAHADLTVERLMALVRALHRHTRGAALPLAGQDNAAGANQVCLWQWGVPLRTSVAGGVPVHDPHRFAWHSKDADLVLWVSSFRPELPELPGDRPLILLGTPGTAPAREPAVFIPVGTPGIDHAGHVFRTDNVVALRTAKLAERGLPTAADVLRRISAALPPQGDGAC